jgi:hypothetical protein
MEIFKDTFKDVKLVIFKDDENHLVDVRLIKADITYEELQELVVALSSTRDCDSCAKTEDFCLPCSKTTVDEVIKKMIENKIATEVDGPLGLRVWNNISV